MMQHMYASRFSGDSPFKHHQAQLKQSVEAVHELYIYSLLWLLRMTDQVLDDKKMRDSKHIRSERDAQFTTKLYDNPFMVTLREHEPFKKAYNKYKLNGRVDHDLCVKLFKEFRRNPLYVKYATSPDRTTSSNRNVVMLVWKKALLKEDDFEQHMVDQYLNWIDDKNIIINSVIGTINDFFSNVLRKDRPSN